MKKFSIFNFQFSIFLVLVASYLLLVTNVSAITIAPPKDNPGTMEDFAPRSSFTNSGINIGDFFGFGDIKSLGEGTTRLVNPLFSVAALLVILYLLFGAFKYLRAGGNKEEVEAGRQQIEHAVVGFILLMLSFLLLQFILSSLFGESFIGIIK